MRRRSRGTAKLWHDTRGDAGTLDWLIVQVPLIFLVAFVITVALLGIRQSGTASHAHLTARLAGTATLASGQSLAQQNAAAWGIPGGAVQVTGNPDQRATTVAWAYDYQGVPLVDRFIGGFHVNARATLRREGFYAGPPGGWE